MMSQKEIDKILKNCGQSQDRVLDGLSLEQLYDAVGALKKIGDDEHIVINGRQFKELLNYVKIPKIEQIKGRLGWATIFKPVPLLAKIAAQNKMHPGR